MLTEMLKYVPKLAVVSSFLGKLILPYLAQLEMSAFSQVGDKTQRGVFWMIETFLCVLFYCIAVRWRFHLESLGNSVGPWWPIVFGETECRRCNLWGPCSLLPTGRSTAVRWPAVLEPPIPLLRLGILQTHHNQSPKCYVHLFDQDSSNKSRGVPCTRVWVLLSVNGRMTRFSAQKLCFICECMFSAGGYRNCNSSV